MIKTIKIMLLPNNKQKTRLCQSAGTARFAYNWALGRQQENYGAGGKSIPDGELRKEFTKLKASAGYAWLNNYSNNITKQAIKDACQAYKNFFDGRARHPRFKSRKKSRPSFYVDSCKVQFTDTHVKLEKVTPSRKKSRQKLNWVRLAEKGRVPPGCKYYNPRVTFDGMHWYISVGVEYPESTEKPGNEGIGIDLGIKYLAVCSDMGQPYININKTAKVRKLKKKKRRMQRQVSRKYEKNRKGDRYCKTKNIKKAEKKLLRLDHRLTGIRHNYLHQATSEIINRKPRFIVMEDLNVKGMLKNRHLSEAIAEQGFYEFYRQMEYKSAWNNIKLIKAGRFYPSSKRCSCCGAVKKDLGLKNRTYRCENCGFEADRDKNAAMNLYHYGKAAV